MKYRKETQENIYRKYMRLFVDIRQLHILKYFNCHATFGSKKDSIDQKKTNTVLKSLENLSDLPT